MNRKFKLRYTKEFIYDLARYNNINYVIIKGIYELKILYVSSFLIYKNKQLIISLDTYSTYNIYYKNKGSKKNRRKLYKI